MGLFPSSATRFEVILFPSGDSTADRRNLDSAGEEDAGEVVSSSSSRAGNKRNKEKALLLEADGDIAKDDCLEKKRSQNLWRT